MTQSRVCLSQSQILERVQQLAEQISDDFAGLELHIVVVLNGAFIFAADLTRFLTVPFSIEFVTVQTYKGSFESRGEPESVVLARNYADASVLVLEDIVDTGRTVAAVMEALSQAGAKSAAIAAVCEKRDRREHRVEVHYSGFRVDGKFVYGYGMDWAEGERGLPYIAELLPN